MRDCDRCWSYRTDHLLAGKWAGEGNSLELHTTHSSVNTWQAQLPQANLRTSDRARSHNIDCWRSSVSNRWLLQDPAKFAQQRHRRDRIYLDAAFCAKVGRSNGNGLQARPAKPGSHAPDEHNCKRDPKASAAFGWIWAAAVVELLYAGRDLARARVWLARCADKFHRADISHLPRL